MGYPPQPPSQPVYAPPRKTNGLAIASLVLGLTGFITCGFTSILAVIFGHVALGQIRRDRTDGHGMAVAGTVLGWVLTGSWLLFWGLSWTGVISSALYTAANPTPTVGTTSLDLPVQPGETGTAAAAGEHLVVFEAVGSDGATSATNITYSVKFDLKQESGVPLPYTKELTYDGAQPHLYLWVQNAADKGVIECRIKVDGQVVREAKNDSPYGVCMVTADKS